MNPLKQPELCGQSPWLDFLKRSLIGRRLNINITLLFSVQVYEQLS